MTPQHKVTVDEALRAVTIEGAYSIQPVDKVGSIKTGKNVDLTILEENPYEVDPMKIKDLIIWGTMLEGRVQPALKESGKGGSKQTEGIRGENSLPENELELEKVIFIHLYE